MHIRTKGTVEGGEGGNNRVEGQNRGRLGQIKDVVRNKEDKWGGQFGYRSKLSGRNKWKYVRRRA